MSRRNFILLIILLVIILATVFAFFFSRLQEAPTVGEDTGGTNFFARFNPFSNRNTNGTEGKTPDTGGEEEGLIENTQKVLLRRVSSMPVAGYGIFIDKRLEEVPIQIPDTINATSEIKEAPVLKEPKTEFATAVRYMARENGDIYQSFVDKIAEEKFSMVTIPKVYETYFGNSATVVIMRYLKIDGRTIETFLGNLPKEKNTDENNLEGLFLPDNITNVSVSPDSKKIFYLFELGEGSIGTTYNLTDAKKAQVFSSPFTEWLSTWPNNSIVTLTTKPSFGVPGYMYVVDLAKKSLNRVMGDINGLTTLTSPNGEVVLYSDNNLLLSLYDTKTSNSRTLGPRTLSEKCVWGKGSDVIYCAVPRSIPPGGYPDTWYQGEVSFSDQIWKMDVATGTTTLVSDPRSVSQEEIDGIKLSLDEDEKYLFFVNKHDSILWELEL